MRGIALALVVALMGCAAPLTSVSPASTIAGQAVPGIAIKVNSAFTFRPALYVATFPAGLYVPQFEDKEGVYFRSQNQIVGVTIAGGRTMTGGLYVERGQWPKAKAYIDEAGEVYRFAIDVPVSLSLVPNQP